MADSPRIEELKRRVQLDPASIAFAALAEEYRRSGRYEEAITVCRTGLARHPSYISAHVTLGRALLEVGHYEEARQELEHVLKVAPENLAAIRGLAEIHERQGHKAEGNDLSASAMAEMAAALAPLKLAPFTPAPAAASPPAPAEKPPAAAAPPVSRLHEIIGPPGATRAGHSGTGGGQTRRPEQARPGAPEPIGSHPIEAPRESAPTPALKHEAVAMPAEANTAPPASSPIASRPVPDVPDGQAEVAGFTAAEPSSATAPSPGSWWPAGDDTGEPGDAIELSWPLSAVPAGTNEAPSGQSPKGESVAPVEAVPNDLSFLDNWEPSGALPWESVQVAAPQGHPAPEPAPIAEPAAPTLAPSQPVSTSPTTVSTPSNPVLERLEAFLLAIEKARGGAADLHIL